MSYPVSIPNIDLLKLIVFDIESYPNYFSFTAYDRHTNQMIKFEVSWRCNHMASLIEWLMHWKNYGYSMVGYNNIGYDYPVIHAILEDGLYSAAQIYQVTDRIINTPWHGRFTNLIPAYKHHVPQIDLFRVHHFDNDARSTSLKKLEFVMRAGSIQDLPYEPGIPIPETNEAADIVLNYNGHDVVMTNNFTTESMKALKFRVVMTEKYGKNFINHNDTKIGKDYFIMELQNAGVQCYESNQPVQTFRSSINLKDCIFDYVRFERKEFKDLLNQMKTTTITETKGALAISVEVDGFSFDFALGGIHGSVKGETFTSNDDYVVTDADVASYYPNLAIKNGIHPEHLGTTFCKVYEDVYNQRKSYAKGTVENAAMKLALNGVYGDSNSMYSVFYDSKYTMSTTINGQLLLCMLAEQLMKIPNMTMIQINTDGLTIRYPRKHLPQYESICTWWETITQLQLEYVDYERMMIRDVNNYIAIDTKGKVKLKGAYVHAGAHLGKDSELDWHKNHSALIVKIAAVKALVDGIPVSKTILSHTDIFDFFLLASVGRKDKLTLRKDVKWDDVVVMAGGNTKEYQRTSRYLVVNDGGSLIKTMPKISRRTANVQMEIKNWRGKKITGLNKNFKATSLVEYQMAKDQGYTTKDGGVYDMGPDRDFEVEANWEVEIFNEVPTNDIGFYDINYNFYIEKAEKLVNGVVGI